MGKPVFVLLNWKIILPLLIFWLHSCSTPENELGKCLLNCNSAECLVLDEEECICVSDVDCIREEFCGGNQADCGCKDVDGGSWCTALTNDSIKTWKFAFFYDSLTKKRELPLYFFHLAYDNDYYYTYRLDNIYLEGDEYIDPYVFSWEFDDVSNPEKIIYRNMGYPDSWPEPVYFQELDIVQLNPDTLILTYRDNEYDGIIAYTAYNP